jgi:hypothetical protein
MNTTIPSGLRYLDIVIRACLITERNSSSTLKEYTPDLRVIGTSLSALYQAATCHRKCYGGPHILEALSGRAYNLACAAYRLSVQGFYDEAMNLVRSTGEIYSLIALSVANNEALRQWLSANADTRKRKFSPVKVREMLAQSGGFPTHADKDWYSALCEKYTHAHPGTRPNLHNAAGQAYVGGQFQADGLKTVLDELATIVGMTAMLVCKYVKLDDLYEELVEQIRVQDKGSET